MLDAILATADARAALAHAQIDDLRAAAAEAPPPRPFASALVRAGFGLIAEIKRASPSAGVMRGDLDPAARAISYVRGGADAISVLTEPEFFAGSLDDLRAVREVVDVPILRKDFTRNAAQVWEARAAGADAVLLIVAALDDRTLVDLLAVVDEAGIEAIVEAHTPDEVVRAAAAGASIIGVNNRDLHTFRTDLAVAEAAASTIPEGVVRIAESGVSTPEGAARMARAGYDAILVGEALVRTEDPATLVASLKEAR